MALPYSLYLRHGDFSVMNKTIILAGATLGILALLFARNKTSSMPLAGVFRWKAFVDNASKEYNIPASRLYGMIHTESTGIADAIGTSGERGLLQIMRPALSDVNKRYILGYTFDDMLKPEANIRTGAAYLRILFDQLGSLDKATQAYNVGASTVLKNPMAGMAYLEKVQSRSKLYI